MLSGRLGEIMWAKGLIRSSDIAEALRRQKLNGWRELKIGGILLMMGAIQVDPDKIKEGETLQKKLQRGPKALLEEVLSEQQGKEVKIPDTEQLRNLHVSLTYPIETFRN